ncbi:hypothetical protein UT300002_30680 [Clostridium perfringens]
MYIKNQNPEQYKVGTIKKSSKYIKIDIIKLAKPLATSVFNNIEGIKKKRLTLS